MNKSKFNKAPLSIDEKEKKAEEFLGFLDNPISVETRKEKKLKKEETKTFVLRIPITLFDELKEIAAYTNISINSICLELLRPGVKKKLKELQDYE